MITSSYVFADSKTHGRSHGTLREPVDELGTDSRKAGGWCSGASCGREGSSGVDWYGPIRDIRRAGRSHGVPSSLKKREMPTGEGVHVV